MSGNNQVPKLRFLGFNGEWEEKYLKDCLEERNEQYPENEEYPLMAFIADKGVSPKGERYDRSALVKDASNKKYKRTEFGDFIYSSNNLEAGSIGLNSYGKACISPVYSIFKSKDGVDPSFMGALLTQKTFISEMVKYRQGVVYGQWKIPEKDFLGIKVSVPTFTEQKKISSCLSDIDKLIAAQDEKVAALKEQKRGLLQQFFPEEGETLPRLRFPEFDGEWTEHSLGDIGNTYSGLSGKTKEDFEKGDSKFITFMNVLNHVRVDTSILGVVSVKDGERQNRVEYGDMLFNTSSETPEEVGFCAVLDSIMDNNVYLNSFCFGYRFKDMNKYQPVFLAYYFRSDYGRDLMRKLAQGITRYNLSKEYFNKAVVKFPSFEEQEKIVNCLTELDKIIDSESSIVGILKEYKKGLIQQLFPKTNK